MVQEAAKYLGDSLRTLATNSPTYTHLSNFYGLQQISDIINSAAKKSSDAKTQERQRLNPPDVLRLRDMGPDIIEDDREDAAQKLSERVREKEKRDDRPENSNVVRDKTYNRPLGRATHRYPIRNVIQQVHKQPTEETISPQAAATITTRKKIRNTNCMNQKPMRTFPPSFSMQ